MTVTLKFQRIVYNQMMCQDSSGFILSNSSFVIGETHDPRVEKVDMTQLEAEHATLGFLVSSIYHKLSNRTLKIEHSLGDGFYCIDATREPIAKDLVSQMNTEMRQLLDSTVEIELVRFPRAELVKFFVDHGYTDKLGLMKTWVAETVSCIRCGDYIDYVLEPMSLDKARLKIFELKPYKEGLVVRFPTLLSPAAVEEWIDPGSFYDMIKEARMWGMRVGCETVDKLNSIIYHGKISELKWIAEGLHEQKIATIARALVDGFSEKRIITIAGPPASNKGTFAMRLSIQLMVNGYKAIVLRMNDFYKDIERVPVGADGLRDFETLEAVDVELLSDRVRRILAGESVPSRRYNFKTCKGSDSESSPIALPPNSFLIIAGIHGLNPELILALGRDQVAPIYVSALTSVNLDFNHRFPTSDLRLIRRIIRDYKVRGYSPRETIARWTSVRIGEQRNIFPFQGNAEYFFNSALVYELPVLSIYAKALLAEASMPSDGEDPTSPKSHEITKEAKRLSGLINLFYPVSVEVVPHISCIREFVGGSDLKQ